MSTCFSPTYANPETQPRAMRQQSLGQVSSSQICDQCPCLFYFRSLVCDGKRGLLTRLLQVMKKEPAESSFR